MSQVISATTKFNHTGGTARARSRVVANSSTRAARTAKLAGSTIARYYKLLETADLLVDRARQFLRDGDQQQALEFAYWAGLRLAGARVMVSPVEKRRRKPKSAWQQLALVNKSSERWAELFQPYSQLSREIELGLGAEISQLHVHALLKQVAEFRAEVAAVQLAPRNATGGAQHQAA